jgi:SAM-dependent methyltransferase
MDQDASWYSSLGEKYEAAFGHDTGLVKFIQKALTYMPPKSNVLDAGCGTGKPVATSLAAAGHSVIGIDISDVMVNLSQKAVPEGRFEVADMLTYEPPEGVQLNVVLTMLSLFALKRKDIEAVAARCKHWLPVDGVWCIGTVAAEDCQPEVRGKGYDEDGRCARDIDFRFMGSDIKLDLMTKIGWVKLLQENGFEIIDTMSDLFVPPKEAECDEELHYYIVAKKVR